MDKLSAITLIKDTLQNSFNKEQFLYFIKNLLDHVEETPTTIYRGNLIPDAYKSYIQMLERICKYRDPKGNKIDVLIIHLKKETSLEQARTMQRNFIALYLNGSRGGVLKDAAIVAFVSPDEEDWRFSFVKMEYKLTEATEGTFKAKEEFTPAKRYSYLVGKNENSHTAQSRLLPLLIDDDHNPLLIEIEDAFSIEKVTKEFFEKYRDLFMRTKEALDEIIKENHKVKNDFQQKGVNPVDFSKKLLGQIVFLYFLQKKGWFGVARDSGWGTGPKNFLRLLFEKRLSNYQNFFNDILEPLFYEALAIERAEDFYSRFNCKIPFLNGGLFDPINSYDWVHTDVLLPDELFSNNIKTKEGDIGTGILDVFDRYNFTVKEDEPLEKEVAVDPEMLGKVFENLLEVKDRKSKGTYYTPREIVHYMCQESLINYLVAELTSSVIASEMKQSLPDRKDIKTFLRYGETAIEHDSRVENHGKETERYSYKLPESIRSNAELIDEKLANIRACDPAIGSGAFPVAMMHEIVKAREILTTYIGENTERILYNFKRHAIQNCLYGVDIDPGAVEIAKLRLWLSLMVDEEDIKHIKPLPNLDYKIVCGNSLLGVNVLFHHNQIKALETLKTQYFEETNQRKKLLLKGKINELFREITNNDEHFDFKVYFSEVFQEKGGFDVVIANPPYLEARSPEFSDQMKEEAQRGAKTRWGGDSEYVTRGSDLLIYFFELGIYVLSDTGTLVFITQNSWLNTDYGKRFQNFLLIHTNVKAIIDSDFKYFDSRLGPNINTVISVFFGKKANEKNVITFARYHENFEKINYSILCENIGQPLSQVEVKKFRYDDHILKTSKWGTLLSSSDEALQIIPIIESKGKRLNELSNYDLSIGQGLNLQKDFVVDDQIFSHFPFLKGRLIPFMTTDDGAPFVLERTKKFIIDGAQLNSAQREKITNANIKIFDLDSTSKIRPLLIMPRGVSRYYCAINSISAYSSSGVDIYDKKGNLPEEMKLNLWFFLNSSTAWLIREITGRKSLGGGLLKAEATDLRDMPIYFNFDKFGEIKKIYEKLKKRQALPTIEEIDTEEHRKIDDIIFDRLEVNKKQRAMIVGLLKKHIHGRITKSKT